MTEIVDRPQEGISTSSTGPNIGEQLLAEAFLNWKPEEHKGFTFEQSYRGHSSNFARKKQIAQALINSGRYQNVVHLASDFVPKGVLITPEITAMEQELKAEILVRHGSRLNTSSEEAKSLQDGVTSYIENTEALKELQGMLPIHVMGAITSAFMFESVDDKHKLEELRKFTTKSLLRPYLGDIRYRRPQGQPIDLGKVVDTLPDQIFNDPNAATYGIVRNFILGESMRFFIEGEGEGFKQLEEHIQNQPEGLKRVLYEDIKKEFEEISSIKIPERFRTIVTDAEGKPIPDENGNHVPFPNFRQKVTLHEFLKTKRKLLNGDTGATKTSCAFLAMEAAGAKKTTVFGPAMARNTWPSEAKLRFNQEDQVNVFTVKSERQLDSEDIVNADYVYISGHLLSAAWKRPELMEKMVSTLVEKRGTDGIILDESDEFRNKGASKSKTLLEIVRRVRDGSEQERGNKIPIVALTATPIATSLKDLDTTMGILYPEKFTFPGEEGDGKTTFEKTVYNDPRVAYSILFGEQLMLQWSQKDMFKNVQEIDPQVENIQLSPTQRAIYDWVQENSKPEAMQKIQLLSSVLLNPQLVKEYFIRHSLAPEAMPREHQLALLDEIYDEYITWWDSADDRLREPFSSDWLVKHGHTDFLIQCFFDKTLVNGIDTLAGLRAHTAQDWVSQSSVSAKYEFLKSILQEKFQEGPDGQITPSEKVFIISPFLKKGFTRWLEDDNVKDSDLEDNAYSLYEYIRTEWLSGIPEDMAISIDGAKHFSERDKKAKEWRTDGRKSSIVVATLKSVYESMNFAIQDTDDNKNIDHATIVFLGWPWGWDDFKQMCGRFVRPGQAKQADYKVLQAEGTIDKGFEDLVYRKFLLTQITLAGIELTPEDQAFLDETSSASTILLREGVTGQNFIRGKIAGAQGRGSAEFANSLIGQEAEWVKTYYDEGKDQFRQVGHNAELTKNVLSSENPERVLSIGAGTCLLARKFQEESSPAIVDNVDIVGPLMHFAKDTFGLRGNMFVGNASNLADLTELDNENYSISDGAYDALDCSFMLDLTSPFNDKDTGEQSERIRVVKEMNRVIKMGGRAAISFHRGAFEEGFENGNGHSYNEFQTFCNSLESNFGFEVVKELTGKTVATDMAPPRRIGWIVTVKKVGEPRIGPIDANSLYLVSDNNLRISKFREKGKQTHQVFQDYPIYSPKKFEIFNPVTYDVTTSDSKKLVYQNAPYADSRGSLPNTARSTEDVMSLLEISQPKRLKTLIYRISRMYTEGDEQRAWDLVKKIANTNGLDERSDVWHPQHYSHLQKLIQIETGNVAAK